MAFLQFERGGQTVRIGLTKGELTIGRESQNDVAFVEREVSRRHARVFRNGDVWKLVDAGSSGGTFLNQRQLLRDVPEILKHGDSFLIGPHLFFFFLEEDMLTTLPGFRPRVEIDEDSPSSIEGSAASSGYGSLSVRPEDKLNGILKINEALTGGFSIDATYPRVLDALMEIFPQADRGAILMVKDSGEQLTSVAERYRRPDAAQPIRISRTILSNVLKDNSAILSVNTSLDPRIADSDSIAAQSIHSTMCAPMLSVERVPFGIISLDALDPRRRFSTDDLQLLLAVANQASHALENVRLLTVQLEQQRQEEEMQLSAEIQSALIPTTLPQPAGYRFFGSCHAARAVGGDYFDCFEMPGGKVCVSFGDVSGKGFPAALIMSRLSGIARNVMHYTDDVTAAVRQINSLMCLNMVDGRFVTYVLGVVDVAKHTFTFCNAGHIPPEVRRIDGRLQSLEYAGAGLPIGLDASFPYEAMTVSLSPGQVVLLRTDGVDEAMSETKQFYGAERFRNLVQAAPPDPETIAKELLSDVRKFMPPGYQNDDITILCFGRSR